MEETKYLIIGSSHAGLTAAEEIRIHDPAGSMIMVTMEDCLPYSPTILPYIVSGKVEEKQIYLRDKDYFKKQNITFKTGLKLSQVDVSKSVVSFANGTKIGYEKLLIATGSEPTLPPTPGLADAGCFVLRTMSDAHKINAAAKKSKNAVIMGTGLVGMHAAEGLHEKGLDVEIIRGRRPAVLPNYFDKEAMNLVHQVFLSHGVKCDLNKQVASVAKQKSGVRVSISDGSHIDTELLVVGTGVRSRMDFFTSGSVAMDEGILVDDQMKTSVDNIWAAGDVAQAREFFGGKQELNAILPDAFEQGKVAGISMAGAIPAEGYRTDEYYQGGLSMNTFNFYGNRSFSVGLSLEEDASRYEIARTTAPGSCVYQKLVFEGNYLVGAIGINVTLDPGVLMNLIRRRVDLGARKSEFAVKPLDMSRRVMWDSWRR
jgi:phenylglyoxylate dehydrogenase epsilon subunit